MKPFCKPQDANGSVLVCEDFDHGLDDVTGEGWSVKIASPTEMFGLDTTNPISAPNALHVVTSDGWPWMNGVSAPWRGLLVAKIPPGIQSFVIEFSFRAQFPGPGSGSAYDPAGIGIPIVRAIFADEALVENSSFTYTLYDNGVGGEQDGRRVFFDRQTPTDWMRIRLNVSASYVQSYLVRAEASSDPLLELGAGAIAGQRLVRVEFGGVLSGPHKDVALAFDDVVIWVPR